MEMGAVVYGINKAGQVFGAQKDHESKDNASANASHAAPQQQAMYRQDQSGAAQGYYHTGARGLDNANNVYLHRHYCNGQCGDRCAGVKVDTAGDGYIHRSYCTHQCGNTCNDQK